MPRLQLHRRQGRDAAARRQLAGRDHVRLVAGQRTVCRLRPGRMPELSAHGVRCLLGHQAVHRQLAAGDADQPVGSVRGVVDHPVAPGELVLVAPPLEERRPDAGGGAHGPVVADGRKHALETLEQVVDLVRQHVDRIQVAIEVVIGGAEEGEPAVGDHQQVTAVDRLGGDREVGDPVRIHEMDALRRPQLDVSSRHRCHLGRPRTARVDHHPRARFGLGAVCAAVADADHLAGVADELGDARVVQGSRTVRNRVLNVREHQSVGVDAPLLHRHRTDEVGRQAGLDVQGLCRGEPPVRVRLFQRLEAVVHLHRRLHALDVVLVVRENRDDEDDAVDEVARDGDDVARVLAGKSGRVPVELEVARTAVDHPARGAGGARAVVALLEEEHRQAAQGQVARHTRAGDAAADDGCVVKTRGCHAADVSGPTRPPRAASGTLR